MTRPTPDMSVKEIVDIYVRNNFKKLQDFFNSQPGVELFQPIDFQVDSAVTEFTIKHGLGFIPVDILVTQLIASSGVKLTVHHGLNTKDDLVVSASGALKARLLVGRSKNVLSVGSGTFTTNTTDTQEFKSKL